MGVFLLLISRGHCVHILALKFSCWGLATKYSAPIRISGNSDLEMAGM